MFLVLHFSVHFSHLFSSIYFFMLSKISSWVIFKTLIWYGYIGTKTLTWFQIDELHNFFLTI